MTTQYNSIPVDAVLALATPSMSDYTQCPVLNISTHALDVLLDQPLPVDTRVCFAVRPEGNGQRPYYVSGEVKQCGLQDHGWQIQISASADRPWSPMFLYDVLCSTFDLVSVEQTTLNSDQIDHNLNALNPSVSNRLAA